MKRFFDFLFSIFFLILLFPLLFFLGLAVSLGSKGGVFYKQTRVGRFNKDFKLYKFRTMYKDSDKKGLLTVGGRDPRVTKTGFFLRKYKLDELPQLINIVKGEMSFIGPRPEVRKYVDLYTPEQLEVLKVRPGLTDWASIEYSNENEILEQQENPEQYYIEVIMPHKLELNRKYVKRNNVFIDFWIALRTVIKIIS